MIKLRHLIKENYLFLIAFFICLLFLIYKIHIGYVYNDEPYIISVGHRLYLGDSLIFDEWHPAQLNGLFVYPFVLMFKNLFGADNSGIILYFRYCYVLIWSLIAIFTYVKLSKVFTNKIILTLSIVYFYLFASMDQMTLSYNMWSLGSLILISVLILSKSNKFTYYFVGFLLSVAVVVCPYLVLLYFFYFLIVFFMKFCHRDRVIMYEVFELRSFCKVTVVCLVSFFILLFYLIRENSVSELLYNAVFVISDPNYSKYTFTEKMLRFFTTIFSTFKYLIFYSCFIIVLSLVDKKRIKLYFLLLCLGSGYSMLSLMINIESTWFNQMMFPIVVLGFFPLIHLSKQSNKIKVVYVIGIIFSFCAYMTSDTEIIATCFGLTVSGFVSFILIGELSFFVKTDGKKRKIGTIIYTILFFQIICIGYSRYTRTYFDKDITIIDSRIAEGPGKFLYTSQENNANYSIVFDDFMNSLEKSSYNSRDSIAILSMNPWLYLSTDLDYCIFSSWTYADINLRLETFQKYLNETKKEPTFVYFLKSDYSLSNFDFLTDNGDYDIIETDISYMLKESEGKYEKDFSVYKKNISRD